MNMGESGRIWEDMIGIGGSRKNMGGYGGYGGYGRIWDTAAGLLLSLGSTAMKNTASSLSLPPGSKREPVTKS